MLLYGEGKSLLNTALLSGTFFVIKFLCLRLIL